MDQLSVIAPQFYHNWCAIEHNDEVHHTHIYIYIEMGNDISLPKFSRLFNIQLSITFSLDLMHRSSISHGYCLDLFAVNVS